MATRTNTQSAHDNAVRAAKNIYEKHGKYVWINPGSEKNKSWADLYIDVIAAENQNSDRAWVIEIETEESVSGTEAEGQWKEYDDAYNIWYLAVPTSSADKARELLKEHEITNCEIVTWKLKENGLHSFRGLPGIN